MKNSKTRLAVLILSTLCWMSATYGQLTPGAKAVAAEPQAAAQSVSSPTQVVPALPVPRLIKFSGVAKDASGQPRSGTVGITFSIYANQEGGAPLWMETQNLELDAHGHYTVLLGSTQSAGMPLDLFATGEPRWLGAKVELPGEVEQPRVLLVSVPYALKASDADTVGGIPASAFVLAPTGSGTSAAASAPGSAKSKTTKSGVKPQFTSSGTVNYLPLFTDSSGDLGNSNIYQSATGNYVINAPSGGNVLNSSNFSDQDMIVALTPPGASDKHAYFGPGTNTNLTLGVGGVEKMRINSAGNVGIGYSNPQQRLVIGAPAGGAVLNATNLADQDLQVVLSAPGASSKYTFFGPSVPTNLALGVGGSAMVWINNSGNVGIDTTAPAATLEVNGTAKFDGLASFASGQTFPGAATLGANTFTGNQTVNANLSATGLVTGAAFNIGSNLFAFGSYSAGNAFLGFAGNATTTGTYNTASGLAALASNTTGSYNAAGGASGLYSNTTGGGNTVSGFGAMYYNTTGNDNTASGYLALYSNTTGFGSTATGVDALYGNNADFNTADGYVALYHNTSGTPNTASGAYALFSNTTGTYNTAAGYYALEANTTGNNNTTSGTYTLANNTTGSSDTAVGVSALADNTTGIENTAIGAFACQTQTTGNDITCTGYATEVRGQNVHNATAIGAHASVSVSDAVVLGSVAGVNGATATTRVGIGTTSPTNLLTLGQGFGPSIADGWATYSSRRWKTNINTLHGALGKVERLRGVSYDLKANGQHEVGVIAEEVGAVVPEVVTWEKNGKDAQSVDYGRLTALLIEATKEQQALIHEQKEQIKAQQAQIARLTRQVKTIQATIKANERGGSAVRTVKAEGTTVRQ